MPREAQIRRANATMGQETEQPKAGGTTYGAKWPGAGRLRRG